MAILIFILANLIAIAIGTAILCGALFIVGGEGIDRDMILKCLAIVVIASAITNIPYMGCFASVLVWVGGIMLAFEKTFGEAIVVALVCWVLNVGVVMGLVAAGAAMAQVS